MENTKKGDKKAVYYVLLLVLLGLVLSGFFLYRYQEDNHKLELHKRLLMERLANTVAEYKFIKTENDSLKEIIQDDRNRILSLMDSVEGVTLDSKDRLLSFEQSFSRMKKELFGLRMTVDSLQQVNDSLHLVNDNIKNRSAALLDTNQRLQKTLTENSSLVIKALRVDAINRKWNGKQEVTNNNFWTDFLRVCFGVGGNKLTKHGVKTAYIRIIKPDNVVMGGESRFMEWKDSSIAYTAEQSLFFEGEAFTECMDITADDFPEGEYKIEIFYNESLQAVTSFMLD